MRKLRVVEGSYIQNKRLGVDTPATPVAINGWPEHFPSGENKILDTAEPGPQTDGGTSRDQKPAAGPESHNHSLGSVNDVLERMVNDCWSALSFLYMLPLPIT